MSNLAIKLDNISKQFFENLVLDNVQLELESGHLYALLGKNGSGKSTLLKILARQERPDRGDGLILQFKLDSDSPTFNEEVVYLYEGLNFALPQKLKKIFHFYSQMFPKWRPEVFESALETFKLSPEKYFWELSRGQKMQVAFSLAVSAAPKLLLIDEITAVLDAEARFSLMGYLKKFCESGGTVVLASNILSDVQHFCDRLIFIKKGTVSNPLSLDQANHLYAKVRKKMGEHHPVFDDPHCVQVALNSDGSSSWVLEKRLIEKYSLGEEILDKRRLSVEDVFIYVNRSKVDEE